MKPVQTMQPLIVNPVKTYIVLSLAVSEHRLGYLVDLQPVEASTKRRSARMRIIVSNPAFWRKKNLPEFIRRVLFYSYKIPTTR
jgi:hypothetical protein